MNSTGGSSMFGGHPANDVNASLCDPKEEKWGRGSETGSCLGLSSAHHILNIVFLVRSRMQPFLAGMFSGLGSKGQG
ncbi:unnamed protein product [Boreogadus saida]